MSAALLRKLGRDLWHRKGAVLALAVIVGVGTGSFVGMAAVWRDMDGTWRAYAREYRLPEFVVNLKRAPSEAVERAGRLANVREVRGRVNFAVTLDVPGADEPISGRAVSLPRRRRPILGDVLLRSGAWFSEYGDREAIVDDAFARAHGITPGERIRVLLLDQRHELLVVGTAMSPEFVYLIPDGGGLAPDPARFGVVFLPETFLQRSCDLDGAYDQVVGRFRNGGDVEAAATLRDLERTLDAYGVTSSSKMSDLAPVRFLEDELLSLETSSAILPTIFLGVAALILSVLVARMVRQQRGVIGTLRAIGWSTGAIAFHLLGYGLAVGILGGVFGLALGYWIQVTMDGIYGDIFTLPAVRPELHLDLLGTGFAISVVSAAFGTLKGLRYAMRLEPAEAMRPPPPERGGRIIVERIAAVWTRLSLTWRMALRSVFRNPFRSAVALLASAVSTALVFTALNQVEALDYLMDHEFRRTSREDVSVSLRDPQGATLGRECALLPGIWGAEEQLVVACDLRSGSRSKRVGATGLAPASLLSRPRDSSGRALKIPDRGLVLSDKLAEILAVGPGDRVRLRPLIGERREREAFVAAVAETFLGLSVYADIAYLGELVGEDQAANSVLGRVVGSQPSASFLTELKRRPEVIGFGQRQRSFQQIEATFGETMDTSIAIMVLFAGSIAFGAVLNLALVSLSEREREVSTFRVLGYSALQVAGIFAAEAALLNAAGVALGLGGGVLLANAVAVAYSTELYRIPVFFSAGQFVMTALLMAGFTAAALVLILRLVRRMPWLDVMKIKE